MLQPENQAKKFEFFFVDIDTGKIKIPKFQREFVWNKVQTAQLLDSIIKGFPIGTFILWKTREELRHFKNIGNISLPAVPRGDSVFYILDGQQRITSLYAVRKGAIIEKDGIEMDYKDISINLDLHPDDDDEIVTVEPPEGTRSLTVYKLLNSGIKDFLNTYSHDEIEKIDIYLNRLKNYDFSTILITDYPIDLAVEIFTRINTGGTELTLFEIMVAKTYDQESGFDLAQQYEWLIDNNGAEKDLEDAGFETIPASTVLQCVSAHLCNRVRRKDILKLDKYKFIDSWAVVKEGIFTAVDYIRTHMRIPVSRLLPYNALLVPLTYFFIKNNLDMPSGHQHKLLTQYFWWASLSGRFSSGAEGKIAQDLDRIDDILDGKPPEYVGEEFQLTIDAIRWRWFSTGDAFCKAIICLYAYFLPRSFDKDGLVKLDNSWLKVATSKNYHHFFPRSYLTHKKGYQDWQANSVLNITIVDDYLNKRKIRAKSPSEYMGEFKDENPELNTTMKTHLIDDLNEFGIWDNDYDKFIMHRAERVLEEINSRLNPDLS